MMLSYVAFFLLMYYAPSLRVYLIIYWSYICFIDMSHVNGGYSDRWPRAWTMMLRHRYTGLQDYLNTAIIKTADLDPSKNYMFLYHPHGIIGLGLLSAVGTEGVGPTGGLRNGPSFSELFPGIFASVATLNIVFKVPFWHEWLLAHSFVSADKNNLKKILTTAGRSLCLIPGGAAEALNSHPGSMRLHIKNRKGFIKIALTTGCSLVPTIGFGENELFACVDNPEGSWTRSIQVFAMKRLGFSVPLFKTFMPVVDPAKPLTMVVGAPMDVEKVVGQPSDELVNSTHALYLSKLKALFLEHRKECGFEHVEIEFV
mmetsp:Transcript_37653/g.86927  ORF Transcript_37653/g.86927 Transcript_37653/m.86927 type:complete len:314 (+) Transcript_37653:2-943(+)